MNSPSASQAVKGKIRVKSGCRTCKIRKVKCDEERPTCHRCMSTGRVCDGYGIWGGGGNIYSNQQRRIDLKNHGVHSTPVSLSLLTLGTEEEKGYFEWFKCRTVTKIPGTFISGFWTTLLFQASLNEPAVLHAILALSSVHRKGRSRKDGSVSKEQENFTLQHYVKAISSLQPHFLTKTKKSLRVPLITCVIFVCLELLRGHFKTAQAHLENGLKILEEIEMLSCEKDGILHLKPSREPTDDWIIEAFSRLYLQVELFRQTYHHPSIILHITEPKATNIPFRSLNEVWQALEHQLNAIFHLTNLARQLFKPPNSVPLLPPSLLSKQQQILNSLAHWLSLYVIFLQTRNSPRTTDETKAYNVIAAYQTMAVIMASTCLSPNFETIYDTHTEQFILLMKQLTGLSVYTQRSHPVLATPGHRMDMAHSIIDVGWVPLLHYVAIKCRIHRIRLQAIRFLETSPHREGIWDGQTMACVARKVMEIEERDFFKDLDTRDDFPLASSPTKKDLELPVLPEAYRIRDLEMVLEGAPMDRILLFGKKEEGGVDFRVLLSEFDVFSQRWVDGCG